MRRQGDAQQPSSRPGGQPPGQALVSREELQAIIVEGDAQKLVEYAERVGKDLADKKLKTHQIRRFFGAVKQIEMAWLRGRTGGEEKARRARHDLILLKPKLAYQARRSNPVEPLKEVLNPAIDLVGSDEERFSRFVEFFEAILAYHRAYGGED